MIDYRARLCEMSEPDYAEFSRKLNPGKEKIIGVRVPKIRALAKEIVRSGEWEAYLTDDPETFEEEMLKSLVIATAPMGEDSRIRLVDSFIDVIDTWAVCDTFCSAWKFKKKDAGTVYDYLSSLMDSGDEFRMRVSVVKRMDSFIDDDHIDDLLEDMMVYRNEGFYYRMGAAWAISFCFIAYPAKTEAALRSGRFDRWVHNKAIQKICESYRVTKEQKDLVRSLRR